VEDVLTTPRVMCPVLAAEDGIIKPVAAFPASVVVVETQLAESGQV
jgi:hypothetical protein